jgi:hypothetical protein
MAQAGKGFFFGHHGAAACQTTMDSVFFLLPVRVAMPIAHLYAWSRSASDDLTSRARVWDMIRERVLSGLALGPMSTAHEQEDVVGRLAFHDNRGADTSVITVDGYVIGWINRTGQGIYAVNTNGRLAAIDGVTGPTLLDVQNHVGRIIQAGNVTLVLPVSMES